MLASTNSGALHGNAAIELSGWMTTSPHTKEKLPPAGRADDSLHSLFSTAPFSLCAFPFLSSLLLSVSLLRQCCIPYSTETSAASMEGLCAIQKPRPDTLRHGLTGTGHGTCSLRRSFHGERGCNATLHGRHLFSFQSTFRRAGQITELW